MRIILEKWSSGAYWLLCNVVGMASLWVGAFLLLFFLAEPPWGELIDRGQFFLYSTGVLAQAIYILTKDLQITILPHRQLLLVCSGIAALVCLVLYTGTFFTYFTDSSMINTQLWLLRTVGLVFFAGSMVLGFFVATAAEHREDIDIEQLRNRRVSRLDDMVSENMGKIE